MRYFLGCDVGATKTHALLVNELGQVVGFGQSGPGNHETVGYDGLFLALNEAITQALDQAKLTKNQISAAGFGVAGYDWPAERPPTLQTIAQLGLSCPVEAVNDTIIGLLAGASQGWGVAVVSGTSCNCWGWDKTRQKMGQVTGGSWPMGEAAGGGELVQKAIQAVAYEWTQRGPQTALTPAFLRHTGVNTLPDLLYGLSEGWLKLDSQAAPLVFAVAEQGDPVALEVVQWAGRELGELAQAVIKQLDFQPLAFELVLVGSLFKGGNLLIDPLMTKVHQLAPLARCVLLQSLPVVGAVLLAVEQIGHPTPLLREQISHPDFENMKLKS